MWVLVAAIPAMLTGFLFEEMFERVFKAPVATAILLLGTATFLLLGERLAHGEYELETMDWPASLTVGIFQAIAILPGISRSGATIAAGRWCSLSREASARFSFLLATPTILGVAIYKMIQVGLAGELAPQAPALLSGMVTSTIVGYICIGWLMRYLRTRSLVPFAVYCALGGLAWLAIAFLSGRL